MLYADDTGLEKDFDPRSSLDQDLALSQVINTFNDISSWMTSNKLKLNNDKTEFLVISSAYNEQFIQSEHLLLDNEPIKRSKSARVLGVIIDSSLTLDSHIANITRTCYYYLRWIRDVRPRVTEYAAKVLVHTLVISRLDYCNSLLLNLPKKHIHRLQQILNYAARLVKLSSDETTREKLISLHWLPIDQRIKFKVALLVHKALNDLAPSYISDLLTPYTPSRCLRSSNQYLLSEHKSKLRYGDRAFQISAPKLWNSLPLDIRTEKSLNNFKKVLKTHLFNKAFYS